MNFAQNLRFALPCATLRPYMAGKKNISQEVEAPEAEAVVRVYEVGYHVIPTFKEEELDSVVGAIRSVIEKSGGSFVAEGAPTLIRLAYPIAVKSRGKSDDYDRAYFGWIKFESSVVAAQALEEALKRDPTIMRHILFRTVREETRARIKLATLREVRRTDTIKPTQHKAEEAVTPVSEEDLDKALQDITTE
jgi:ribosomal protein S6